MIDAVPPVLLMPSNLILKRNQSVGSMKSLNAHQVSVPVRAGQGTRCLFGRVRAIPYHSLSYGCIRMDHYCVKRDRIVMRRMASVRCLAESVGGGVAQNTVSVVLLAGGVGKRMGAPIPKQYLELRGKPIATYSLETFSKMPCVGEVVVVCEDEWKSVFEECHDRIGKVKPLKFASPGAERQDSVFNGLQEISPHAELVAIHDSARPLVRESDVLNCIIDATEVGAAVLGVPVKPTIKEADEQGMVVKTLKRSVLWEVQTPQVIRPAMLAQGFDLVKKENLEVTDDVSIIEAMGNPVRITKGCYTNIKVTTPEDMAVAEGFLD